MGKALIETANSKDPNDLANEVIFVPDTLPPEESGTAPGAASVQAVFATSEPAEIEQLEFVGDKYKKVVDLEFPFVLKGEIVEKVTVRRLRIGDVDRFIRRARAGEFSTFDIYAEMTGLPAAVLRGLISEDGDNVTDACFDFLPRVLKAEPEPSES